MSGKRTEFERASPGAQRIIQRMVADTLDLANHLLNSPTAARSRIGNYEWCEPDYRQILRWAEVLKMNPSSVVQKLLEEEQNFFKFLFQWAEEYLQRNGNIFAQGRMLRVKWDLRLLPLTRFEWVNGLQITHLCFANPTDQPVDLGSLPLPCLRYLDCSGTTTLSQLRSASFQELELLLCGGCPDNSWDTPSQLVLSGAPRLKYLDCYANALAQMNLTETPLLKHLDCSYNQIEQLDLAAVPELISLICGFNRIHRLAISSTPGLRWLDCSLNRIESLDLSSAAHLQYLDCAGNNISELDLAGCSALESLHCTDNPMRHLDIRPLERLVTLKYDPRNTRLTQRADQHF
jgi:Leucine-rich repeat (LRR) protein